MLKMAVAWTSPRNSVTGAGTGRDGMTRLMTEQSLLERATERERHWSLRGQAPGRGTDRPR